MRLLWCTLALSCGCGRFGFDAVAHDPDASNPIDATAPDGAVLGPFGPPAIIDELVDSDGADDASLTGDLLEIYFNSDRVGGVGGGDLWTSRRASVGASWQPPVNVVELNTTGSDATPGISSDGLTLYFAAERDDAIGVKDLYVATRPDRDAPWEPPERIAEVASTADEAGPAISVDELTLYFTSNRDGDFDVYRSTRASAADPWSAPVPVTELNSDDVESEPWPDGPQTTIVLGSRRPGGAGGTDLYEARRATADDPFGAPMPIVELNTDANDTDPWLSPDGRTLVFTRGDDLYITTR